MAENEKLNGNNLEEVEVLSIGEGTDPIPPVPAPVRWDLETDVLVIGGGGAGLAAAAAAVEEGVKVVVLERLPKLGGASATAHFLINVYGSKAWQESTGLPFDEDMKLNLFLKTCEFTAYQNSTELDRALIENAGHLTDWLSEKMGIKWHYTENQDPCNRKIPLNFHYPVSSDYMELPVPPKSFLTPVEDTLYYNRFFIVTHALEKYSEKNGVKFLLRTRGNGLIKNDEGRVIGIRAVDKAKKELYIQAKKGVILTAGSYAANREMLKRYDPEVGARCGCSIAPPCHTGEGIRMGMGVGGRLEGNNDKFACMDGGINSAERDIGPFCQFIYQAGIQLARQPFLWVNKLGKRFHNEDTAWWGFESVNAMFMQPGATAYTIFDEGHLEETLKAFEGPYCERLVTKNDRWLVSSEKENQMVEWHESMRKAIERGKIKKVDTIKGLSEIYDIDAESLEATVSRYNQICERGKDWDFGKDPKKLFPITTPPFYIIEQKPIIFDHPAGLRINSQAQVLDEGYQVIPGLFSGGSNAGPQQVTLKNALVFGYIAGKNAVKL